MEDHEHNSAATFHTSGQAYDAFMGRYSKPLAVAFADMLPDDRHSALDVGCGPGALTRVLADRMGAESVSACDPSAPFVQECAARCPGVDVRSGRAEAIPFSDGAFDVAGAQLVLHFVSDPPTAALELRRVLRDGGMAAACVWDTNEGVQMLTHFWDAVLLIDPQAPEEARSLRFGQPGEVADLFREAGFHDVAESTLTVTSMYTDYDELWSGFLAGIGPAGAYCTSLPSESQAAVRQELFRRVGAPDGSFSLSAVARCITGLNPQ